MTDPIVLYCEDEWDSPYVFSVFVALHEKKLPFVERVLDLTRGEHKHDEFRARSLTARVPCIEHAGFALSESLAIHEYLDEAFPEQPRLLPEGTEARARARQVLGWLRSDLMPLREDRPTTSMFYARTDKPLSERGQAAADKLFEVTERLLGERGSLFDRWSIADADLSFMIHRLILNDDPVPKRVRAYATAQWQRPSVQAFVHHARPAKK